MTFAELDRALASKRRMNKIEEQKQASFDYILADLIGRSVARVYNSSNKMPAIQEIYTELFSKEEMQPQIIKKKNELSAIRFRLFAETHNAKFKGVVNKE